MLEDSRLAYLVILDACAAAGGGVRAVGSLNYCNLAN